MNNTRTYIGAVSILCVVALFGFVLWVARTGDTSDVSQSSDTLVIAGTIFPVYDIARIVAGDDAEVLPSIIPPGTSPHYFEATPSLIQSLSRVDVVFTIGGIDEWAHGFLPEGGNVSVVSLEKGIQLREGENHDHEEDEDDHEEHEEDVSFDPHYWLDPTNAVTMAHTIADTLASLDTPNADAYHDRAEQFAQEIASRDSVWRSQIATLTQKDIVTFHDAFMYFAQHFGLTVSATFEPFPGKEPTAQYMVDLQESVRERDILTLYIEPQLSHTAILQFAKDIGAEIAVLDPIGGVLGRDTYIDLIDYNIQTIIDTNT